MRKPSPPNPPTLEPRRADAIASLQESWRIANESGLDKITDAEIDAEITAVRT